MMKKCSYLVIDQKPNGIHRMTDAYTIDSDPFIIRMLFSVLQSIISLLHIDSHHHCSCMSVTVRCTLQNHHSSIPITTVLSGKLKLLFADTYSILITVLVKVTL
jgi:hypothetical protein